MLIYSPTPLKKLTSAAISHAEVDVQVKCEYLNHPHISGNKWWKLHYNLQEAQRQGHHTLLTFGGAYSNHIYATAAAAQEHGLNCIGVIRGEETLPLNKTLSFAKQCGMRLHYVSREDYRSKTTSAFIQSLHQKFGEFYLIPEGGTNELAIKGVAEFGRQLRRETEFEYLCCACGTGGTLAGLITSLPDKELIGFSSLKGNFMEEEIKRLIGTEYTNWTINNDFHFGGYAKTTQVLLNFMKQFEKDFSIPLDQVYTAKAMVGTLKLIEQGYFPRGSRILFLHTGGLQGNQ